MRFQCISQVATAQLAQRKQVQEDRARDHESRGQYTRISPGADARYTRNDQLQRAGRGDHSRGDRAAAVISSSPDRPLDQMLIGAASNTMAGIAD
jgi:hypothetical protein